MKRTSIFIDEQENSEPINNSATFLGIGSLNSISHFLVDDFQSPKKKAEKASESPQKEFQGKYFYSKKKSSKKPSQKSYSKHHNFQKHLVTTLRNLVTLNRMQQFSKQYDLELKIWEAFKKNKYQTKQLINQLFFSCEYGNYKKGRKYGYGRMISKVSPEQFSAAQGNLRQEIFQQLKTIDFSEVIKSRKLEEKQVFLAYLQLFLKDLRTGILHQRVPNIEPLKSFSERISESSNGEEQQIENDEQK